MSGRTQAFSRTALFCGGLLLPCAGMALGLGEARVNSYLNQPLDAHIFLIDADADALASLAVRPGSAEDYQRVGMDLGVLRTPLEVTVDRNANPPVVRVTSSEPITDPVMQILVYARWGSGRVLREYTLFLDPPLIDIAPTVASRAREDQPVQSVPPPTAAPAESRRDVPRMIPPGSTAGSHRVQAGDTLWSIAYNWRQDSSLNMNQVLLAFQQLNPNAFADGNVNHMRRGVDLQFPTAEDVRALDVRRAEQEIQAQMQAWHSRPAHEMPVISDAAVEVAQRGERPGNETSHTPAQPVDSLASEARLSLVPPDADSEAMGDPLGDPEAEAEIRRLRGVLARTDEEMDHYQFERREVSARAAALREGIEAREQGLGITDGELADLEDALRAARLAAAEQAALASRDTQDDVLAAYFGELEAGLGIGPANSDSIPGRENTAAQADAAQADPPEMRPVEAPRPPTEDPTLQWLIWVVIVLALAGTVTAMFLISRRKQPKLTTLDDLDREWTKAGQAGRRPVADVEAVDESGDEAGDEQPAQVEQVDDDSALMRILAEEDENGVGTDGHSVAPDEEEAHAVPEPGASTSEHDDIFSLDETEAGVKLDLAQAYLSMGDREAARTLLNEVIGEGSPELQERARRMLEAL